MNSADARMLEDVLGKLVAALRLEMRQMLVERHGGGDTIASRVFRGEPVNEVQWLQFVRALQHPAHTWRNGGGQ